MGAKRHDRAAAVNVQGALAQPLDVQIQRVLKRHGRERETLLAQAVEEGVKIHVIGRLRLIRRAPPVARDIGAVVLRAAALARGVLKAGERAEFAVRLEQKRRVKPAERMVAPRGEKGVGGNARLRGQIRHEAVERIALRGRGLRPPEVAHGLEVHPAHSGDVIARKADDLTQRMIVHAGDDGRHERDAEAERVTNADGLGFFFQQRRAAQGLIDPVVRAVELQENDVKPRLGEAHGIVRLAREAQAVRV